MISRQRLLLVLLLLAVTVGIVVAQSSANYALQRFVIVGGDSAASAHYSVTSVIGQPATDVVTSLNYKVAGGFLRPAPGGNTIFLPTIPR